MTLQSLHFMDRDGVNEVGLARLQGREASGILGDFAKDDFFDRCFAAPIVVVARENHVAATLETDKLIRTGADQVLIQLITVLFPGHLAEDETVSQSI